MTSTGVDAKPAREPRSAEDLMGAIGRLLRAMGRRAADGELGLVELAAIVELETELAELRNRVARRLLADDFSHREIGVALGVSRQAVERRYPGAASRRPGGQPGPLR